MSKMKLVLGGVLVGLVVFGSGWLWGASGRWAAESALRDAEARERLADARGALASARVDLFELNYGQASRHLQQATGALTDVLKRFEAAREQAAADGVRASLARAVEAQQLAASVHTDANERVAEALRELERATPSAR